MSQKQSHSVIPGWSEGPDPESRDSGSALRASRNDKSPLSGAFSNHIDFTLISRPGSVRVGPDLLLREVHQEGEDDQHDENLEAELLARFHLRLRRPHQEGGDVVRILR